jgi:hypothetical protein
MAVGAVAAVVLFRRRAGLVALAVLGPVTKVAGVAVMLFALNIPDPLASAVAIVPALELAGLLPLTPANLGAASAAMCVVLHARGVLVVEALSVSIVIHGVETVAGVAFGGGSAIFLAVTRRRDPTTAGLHRGRWRLSRLIPPQHNPATQVANRPL